MNAPSGVKKRIKFFNEHLTSTFIIDLIKLHHRKVHEQDHEYNITPMIFIINHHFLQDHQKTNDEVHCT